MSSRQIAAFGVSLFVLGCNQKVVLAKASAGSVAGTAASGGTTQGFQTSGSSGSGTGGDTTGRSSTAGTSAGGSTTGNATTGGSTGAPSPYIDGGYVQCSVVRSDAGLSHWMCQPGSYVCDPGASGNCFQCQSDRDCADQTLPTYDPNRPHCDLVSGVSGYQNFCQQCTANADCASNPAGPLCDLNPTYPPAAQQPSIDTTGFETCTRVQTDCRQDGGPACRGYNQFCDAAGGQCTTRTGACKTDQDCVGVTPDWDPYLLAPICVAGVCSACDGGGICPEVTGCQTDKQCGNPSSSPSGLLCNNLTGQCSCTDDGQCGGFWPVCLEFDAGLGSYCGCDSDAQCGDAGLVCLTGPYSGMLTGVCGIPCTSPSSFQCTPHICDAVTRNCEPCSNDAQCQADPAGSICYDPAGAQGICGCQVDGDCPSGEICQTRDPIGACTVPLPRCTPESCGDSFCDWDSGSCEASSTCFDDYDCANQLGDNSRAAFCQNGQCVTCRSNADCLHSGWSANGASKCCLPGDQVCADANLPSNTCEQVCAFDQDCIGNYYGPSCAVGDAGLAPRCGCASDSDCTGAYTGLRCNRDPTSYFFGSCGCAIDSDCPAGVACEQYAGGSGQCFGDCYHDAGCTAGYTCDPTYKCRPRCDLGYACEEPDLICDQGDEGGQNGDSNLGSIPGLVWCYACLQASDCTGGVGCDPELGCGHCRQSSDCPSGKACIDGGICQPTCVDGGCPPGEVCDTYGLAGYGPNVCYGCVSAADCPNGEGCDSQIHSCGTCEGPTAAGGPFDCAPDAVCSNYWKPTEPYVVQFTSSGVCLTNCDRQSCPGDQPICAVLPGLTPDHKYCFGCLQDSDCSDAGAGAYCDVSPTPTFNCRLPAGQ